MIMTKEILKSGISSKGGFNKYQIKELGLKFPLKKRWSKNIIGKEIPDINIKNFLALKNYHLK